MDRATIDSVIRSLRRVNLQGSFFGQTVAVRFGLTESDVEALELLLDTGAATAGKLSELTGLTSGAVTRVIDRLEQAGYVRRVPDPADRRRVVVEVVPERIAAFEATIDRVGAKGAVQIGHYSEAELAVINDFLTKMADVTREEATALRETPLGEDGHTAQHAAPLGGLEQAKLLFRSGANELVIRGSSTLTDLYQASFDGPVPKVRLRNGVVVVHYQGRGLPWDWRKRNADLTLNATIPWDVEINGGANRFQGDLQQIALRSFELTGGVDRFRLALGTPDGSVPIRLNGGANQFRIERPAGVPVQLRLSGGAGGIELDRQQLAAVGGNTVLESAGASKAADRYTIDINGGASRIVVREADAS
jgi:DNA-binding MarR family transcriptional regulator